MAQSLIALACLWATAQPAFAGEPGADKVALDYVWVLLCAAIVFLMQAGFLCIESGFARAKNSINVAIKNTADFLVAVACFWIGGFALMFGQSDNGLFGATNFFVDASAPWLAAFFVFQCMFAGTAATINSGALAGRVRFGAYLVWTIVVSGLIYPVFGHWAWGSAYHGPQAAGWLEAWAFHDFAGGTVVHAVGGWVALAAIVVVGPRADRFDEHGKARRLLPSNLTMVFLGTLILFFGWFGFNAGNTLAATPKVGSIAMVTAISGVFGGLSATAVCWLVSASRKPAPEYIANGLLGGLVAITPGADVVPAAGAAIIGTLAGVLVYVSMRFIERVLKLDDAVGAVAVHGVSGTFGTLALTPFVPDTPFVTQLTAQAVGVGAAFVWAFGTAIVALAVARRFVRLRPTEEEERIGLNVAEHGASSALLDLALSMRRAQQGEDFGSLQVEAEIGTEVGELATCYNGLVQALHTSNTARDVAHDELRQAFDSNQAVLETISDGIVLLDKDGLLGSAHSAILARWFGPVPVGQPLWRYLEPVDASFAAWLELGWEGLMDGFLPLELSVMQLPKRLNREGQVFGVRYTPVVVPRGATSQLVSLMVVLCDITADLAFERALVEHQELVDVVGKLAHDRAGFANFFGEAGAIVVSLQDNLGRPSALLRHIHTLKGNCGLFGVGTVVSVCHDVETALTDERASAVHIERITAAWEAFAARVAPFLPSAPADAGVHPRLVGAIAVGTDPDTLMTLVDWLRLDSIQDQLERCKTQVEDLAVRLGKGPVRVVAIGNDLRLDHGRLRAFWSSLVHVLRNAVDHGLETTEARVAAGKAPVPTVEITAHLIEGRFCVTVADDGGGIDWPTLRAKVASWGLPANSRSDLEAALFVDGISTRDQVSDTSGRGVGLGAVRQACLALGGLVTVDTEPGGTSFAFHFDAETVGVVADPMRQMSHIRPDPCRALAAALKVG